MTNEKYMRWAIADHLGNAGAQQPSASLSTVEEHGGRQYVVLRNVSGVLSVYRVYPTGVIGSLSRWPKGVRA